MKTIARTIINIQHILQKDIGDIINEWFEIYKYKDLPTIDFENFYLCEEPIVGRETTSLKIYIPLIGEYDSLQYEPYRQSLWCRNYEAEIEEQHNRICMKAVFANKVEIDVDDIIESTVAKRRVNIESQYKYLTEDIFYYNNYIFSYIKSKFEKLYKKVQIQIELEEKTKKSKYLRIEPKVTVPIKLEQKVIETKNVSQAVLDDNVKKITALENESYIEIYNNLKELSVYAQRLTKSYRKLLEEENRDQLINALNLKLKTATATGETFNVKGKSDIIIIDNKIIYYLAECKIWHGASKFKEAIDQLLSYISADIFYSSLIIFNKNKSDISDLAINEIKKHNQFMAEISKNRYKFKHPTRENETLEISLIIFNVFYEE